MHALVHYDSTDTFDPTDPNQRVREFYNSSIGSWDSAYWNRVRGSGSLSGLGGGFSSLPGYAQLAVVLGAGLAAGYLGWKKFGESHIRPTLKKVPVVGGLMGARTRRRRR